MQSFVLQVLSDAEREVVFHLHYDHETIAETARLLGISPAAVRDRHQRAIRKLRKVIQL